VVVAGGGTSMPVVASVAVGVASTADSEVPVDGEFSAGSSVLAAGVPVDAAFVASVAASD